MTTTPPPFVPRVPNADREILADLAGQSANARAELVRIDGKASGLLSWAGGAFAVIAGLTITASTATDLPAPATAALITSAGLLACAIGVLLAAVRPRVPRTGGTGFILYARATTAHEVLRELMTFRGDRVTIAAEEVHILSRLAVTKYRRLRLAVDVLLVALAALVAALPLSRL
ncbi:hypothetical protein Skr01_57250 [Sphaerisporangium krabiense]|uniref:Pycsar effector protein domain-containing protein n=1 Tax=Sphaerisporangium krabiense TaxID=763782 RepID=A0A7W8Z8Q8_9ACTN|nr:Pycsar system effector family protein [Sphaerisporangium krabiense]MBB5629508.1 hypothetical protein [Sphaerisporangium krabiense]GII65640.1 hypothetical protein Skr01_57250 [Sphaerisporangium krabiense]